MLMAEKGKYLIYGAGIVAYQTYIAVNELYHIIPLFFVVSDAGENEREIDGISVRSIHALQDEYRELPVVIATPEIYHEQIIQELGKAGVQRWYCIDSKMEYNIMSKYFRKRQDLTLLEDMPVSKYAKENITSDFSVFMAKSEKDKPLKKQYDIPDWIIPVQAGSAVSNRMPIQPDDQGKNISLKNADYCELTVAYWAWKNQSNRYKGICHYRRMLKLTDRDLQAITENNIDIVLPLPFVCYPDATGQYKRYIKESDIICLRRALHEVSPEYLEIWRNVDKGPLFYNYNMIIARESVYDDYCAWMFRVLEKAEQYCEADGKERKDRYAGYLGELLTTLFIYKNKERYSVVHAEKVWMI